MSDATVPEGPVAYLTGEYPKVSHTFIAREIDALRALGVDIRPCTIRRAAPHELGPGQEAARAETFAVVEAARAPLRLLRAQIGAVARDPRAWGRAARLAWRTRPPGAKAGLWQLFYLLEAAVLADHLRAIGARHLHNHFVDSSCTVAMLTAEMTGLPFSFTLHGPTELYAPAWWRLDEKAARAAFSCYISHFARSQAMLFSDPKHWARMRIVRCGIDPDRLPPLGPARDRDGAGAGRVRALFVGRLSGVKGAPLLLDAVARLAGRHPGLDLVLVGDGPERPALEERARDLGVAGRVRFAGFLGQDGVVAELAAADMLVLPSFAEGVPVVLMEAMATALPVVSSRIMGIPELVEHGVSGLLTPPGDLDALTAALDRLAADPAAAAAMGRAGHAAVTAGFAIGAEGAWLARLLAGSQAGRLPEGLRPGAPVKSGGDGPAG